MNCTSIPTNLISMVPVLENIFCITIFIHAPKYALACFQQVWAVFKPTILMFHSFHTEENSNFLRPTYTVHMPRSIRLQETGCQGLATEV